jgi:hypothetical protein
MYQGIFGSLSLIGNQIYWFAQTLQELSFSEPLGSKQQYQELNYIITVTSKI